MAADLAELGIKLTNEEAIAGAQATGRAFEDMGTKGETAARRLTLSSNPVTDAVKRQATETERLARAANFVRGGLHGIVTVQDQVTDSTRRMTLTQMEAIKINEAMGQSAKGNHVSLGRLGNQFESLATRIAGVHPIVGKLASVLGDFAVGGVVTVGVLAGLALLAVAYDKLTDASRKAMEVADKLAESYNRAARISALGIGGQQKADIEDINKGLEQHAKWLNTIVLLRDALAKTSPTAGAILNFFAGRQQTAIAADTSGAAAAEQQRVNAIGMQNARDNQAWADRVKDENDKAKKAADTARAQRDKERSERFLMDSEAARHGREDFTGARQLRLVPETAIKSLDSLLTPALIRAAKAAEKLSDSFESAKDRFQFGKEGWKPGNIGQGIVSGVQGGIGDALTQFSPANLAGSAVTSLLSTAISGVISSLGELFSSGKAAAEEARKMARDFKAATDTFHAAAVGDTLMADQIRQQQAYNAQVDAINARFADSNIRTWRRAEQDALLASAAADEAIAQARILAQHAHDVQYATEDLVVRNLRATGQGDQADLLAFQNQQAREMAAAIDANRDATYLSYLATVQNNELIAFQNGLLSTAIRNQPTGFYGIESYLGEFATRRGALGGISGGGADPLSPVNPTGGLTPPGGRSPVYITFQAGSITVDADGNVKALVSKIDQKAASTGGRGSSRAAALELL